MARVRRIIEAPKGRSHEHPTEVDCDWVVVESSSGSLLQLTTYGSEARAIPGKVSQTLQFDRDTARALRAVIDATFPEGE